nr:MAG TPA: hypothetical protein [Caudoviricetes sp.]
MCQKRKFGPINAISTMFLRNRQLLLFLCMDHNFQYEHIHFSHKS